MFSAHPSSRQIYPRASALSDLARGSERIRKDQSEISFEKFSQGNGMKFTEFIQKERIREACVLLRTTEMSCIEIANALSFSSQSYFIKIFSDVMGITPQKYRADGKIVG